MMTYREAVVLVALNDDPENTRFAQVRDAISTMLIAEIYREPNGVVAKDIISVRKKERLR